MRKVLECLRVMEYVDIGFKRPATIPLAIVELTIVVIGLVMIVEVDICLKRTATTHLSIMEQ